jgi:hypothetical protein
MATPSWSPPAGGCATTPTGTPRPPPPRPACAPWPAASNSWTRDRPAHPGHHHPDPGLAA